MPPGAATPRRQFSSVLHADGEAMAVQLGNLPVQGYSLSEHPPPSSEDMEAANVEHIFDFSVNRPYCRNCGQLYYGCIIGCSGVLQPGGKSVPVELGKLPAQPAPDVVAPERTCRDGEPVQRAVGAAASLDHGVSGPGGDKDIAAGGAEPFGFAKLTIGDLRHVTEFYIAEMQRWSEGRGYPPNRNAYCVLGFLMREWVRRYSADDADRDFVKPPGAFRDISGRDPL